MTKYEYKTVYLKQTGSTLLASRKIPDLEDTLNHDGQQGWRLCEVISRSESSGTSDKVILILERELE